MNNKILLCLLILGASVHAVFAQKNISLEDIWLNYSYYSRSVPGFNFMNDGESYSRLQLNKVQKYSIKDGQFIEDLFALEMLAEGVVAPTSISGYSFSADEQKILVESNPERIYRYAYSVSMSMDTTTPIYGTLCKQRDHQTANNSFVIKHLLVLLLRSLVSNPKVYYQLFQLSKISLKQ